MKDLLYRWMAAALLLGAVSTSAGCGRWAVRPQERELLADRAMQLDGDPQEAATDDHVLSNREGSHGAGGTGGGGCGCN
jgi:hypothetical protein